MNTTTASRNAPARLTPQAVKQTVPAMQAEWSKALPAHVSPERFARIAQTAVLTSYGILGCTPESIWAELTKCAQDGLVPDGREAALVAYDMKGTKLARYMPMIGGILKRMRQSGDVKEVDCHVVYANDDFEYELGDTPHLRHRPNVTGDRGAIVGAYAIVRTTDGGVYREFMPKAEIDQVKRVSRAGDKGPWGSWYGEMARKTVMRRLAKWLPWSQEDVDRLMRRDDDLYDLNPQKRESALEHRFNPQAIADDRAANGDPEQNIRDDTPDDRETIDADFTAEESDADTAEPAADERQPEPQDETFPGDRPAPKASATTADKADDDPIKKRLRKLKADVSEADSVENVDWFLAALRKEAIWKKMTPGNRRWAEAAAAQRVGELTTPGELEGPGDAA